MNAAIETSIVIRDIDARSEVHAVEELQKDVWGIPDLEVVPLSQLVAAKTSGGVLVGAFDGDELAGFVYGFVGYERGMMVHHSHMLAVKPNYRKHDLGFRLKVAQRERALTQGITVMTWTFDPLRSLNAYFNINKLGAVSDQYFVNFYGEDAASFLHRNDTDRLWVNWHLTSSRVIARLERSADADDPSDLPRLVVLADDDQPLLNDLGTGLFGDWAAIEIPGDISELERLNADLAVDWRTATRRAFTMAMDVGFIVTDFYRSGQGVGVYVLSRKEV